MPEQSTPALVESPEHGGLADSLFRSAAQRPDTPLFHRRGTDGWQPVSAAEFAGQVQAAARGLIGLGLRPGQRIGLMSRNRYEWAVLDYAIWSAGCVSVPLYPTASADQVEWILRDSGAVGCVTETAEHAAVLDRVADQLPGLRHRWSIEDGAVRRLLAAGDGVEDGEVRTRRATVTPDDVATIVYTSGTTGRPKGCVLSHANFAVGADNATALLYPVFRSVSEHPASTVLFLPLAHVFGRLVQVACVRAEVCVGHAPSVRPEDLRADLTALRPTFLLGVPYVFEKIQRTARLTAERMGRLASFDRAVRVASGYGEALERVAHGGRGPGLRLRALHALYDLLVYRKVRAALGGRVRYAICGGAMLGRRLALFFAGAGVIVYEGYGLTETTAATTVNPPLRPRFGTVGLPLPGAAVRVDDGGEVLVRGPHVFRRYWQPDRDSAPGTDEEAGVLGDGWLRTGDLGELDADGYLTITGRARDLIVTSGGKNVAPEPLEDAVRADPLVDQCLVIGDNRRFVAALITLDAEELARWRDEQPNPDAAAPVGGTDAGDDPGADTPAVPRGTGDDPDADLYDRVRQAVDRANAQVSRAESIRRFRVLDGAFTEQNGLLTPSLKMRRQRIVETYATEIEQLYAQRPTTTPR
ncbi:MAG: AMP-dependent synthetase/ligase [Actinocatenispora sp.]